MNQSELPVHRHVNAFPVGEGSSRFILLQDPEQISEPIGVPLQVYLVFALLDGRHTIQDIQVELHRLLGELVFSSKIKEIVDFLDEHFLLDTPRYRRKRQELAEEFQKSSVRPALFAGKSYEADAERLKTALSRLINKQREDSNYSGVLEKVRGGRLVGAIAPHYDIARGGGTCMADVFGLVDELCEADLFVILGTAHTHTDHLITITDKDFETPLGITKTDKEICSRIIGQVGETVKKDELAHKWEHSVEFQVLFLNFIMNGSKDFAILPVLCGSFHELLMSGKTPEEYKEFSSFIDSTLLAIEESGKKPFFIASADLAHVGLRFGDPRPDLHDLARIEKEDRKFLEIAAKCDARSLFESIRKDRDRRRVCGFPAIFTLLKLLRVAEGELINYKQQEDPGGGSVVSFASMIFHK